MPGLRAFSSSVHVAGFSFVGISFQLALSLVSCALAGCVMDLINVFHIMEFSSRKWFFHDKLFVDLLLCDFIDSHCIVRRADSF